MPICPLAPGRFSTTICCPSLSDTFGPMRRERMSAASPGGYGTITLIGLEGYDCANAAQANAIDAATAHARPALVPYSSVRAITLYETRQSARCAGPGARAPAGRTCAAR